MHCTSDQHVESVFLLIHGLMEREPDDRAVAAALGSLETLQTLGHVVTREDLVAVFSLVRGSLAYALNGFPVMLDVLVAAGWSPRMIVRWCDGPQGRAAIGRPITSADLVAALRMAEDLDGGRGGGMAGA